MHESLGVLIGLIVVLGIGAQWLAWWLKLPSIVFLLLIGIVAGPVSGVLNPDVMFGEILFPLVSLGVALVLFEGALTLHFSDIRGHGSAVTNLVSWGAVLNWLLIAGGTWVFTDFSWSMALLFGALVVVTGPTVVVPLLRTVRPTPAVSNILRWEGILIDPLGALFVVLIYEAIVSDMRGGSLEIFFQVVGLGVLSGGVGALGLGWLLKRHLVPEYLQNVVTLATVIGVFSFSNHFAHESGLLAVTVMGVWLANTKNLDMSDILSFKESLSVLIISVLFIVLAARLDFQQLIALGWGAIGVLMVILLARPVMVWASTLRGDLGWREKVLISWIAPRGIVAAAVSSLFALKLEQLGYTEASSLAALTFLVIIVTVLLQSFTARPLARMLGVAEEEPRGVLIIGANSVARALGKVLVEKGFRVKVTDTNWSDIQAARMDGLQAYFGNPVSAHADRHLDLVGIGRVFAMSRRPALNILACLKYRAELGKQRVFTLRNAEEKDDSEKVRVADVYRAPRLFGEDVTSQKIASLLSKGGEVKATRLSEEFTLADYEKRYGADVIKLFAIDNKERLRAYTDTFSPDVKPGWVLISLIPESVMSRVEDTARQAEQGVA